MSDFSLLADPWQLQIDLIILFIEEKHLKVFHQIMVLSQAEMIQKIYNAQHDSAWLC